MDLHLSREEVSALSDPYRLPQHVMDETWRRYVTGPRLHDAAWYELGDGPSGAGVYFLWTEVGERLFLAYVGQSVCIATRLEQHRMRGRMKFHGFTFIETPADLAPLVESPYLHALRPAFNLKFQRTTWRGERCMERIIKRLWREAQG